MDQAREPPLKLKCLGCHNIYHPDDVTYFCPRCQFDSALDVEYDYCRIGAHFRKTIESCSGFDMWRYRAVLPVTHDFVPQIHTGGSPLYKIRHKGTGNVFIKDDSRNPSGSLKDRASALAVALASRAGVDTIAAASTGNAAAALACMSAGSGIRCVIFAPKSASREKLAQIRAYGADVIEVNGGYDEAFETCYKECFKNGWYNRSTGINSYMTEGKKTVAFEIWEQMNWQIPDRVFVPVGNGCIVGAVYKGFHELQKMGCTDRIPTIMGVQAIGSNFMYRAWRAGTGPNETTPLPTNTSASSISVSLPRDRHKAWRAITQSGGEFVCVSDKEIFEAVVDLARMAGVFAEPGAAAAFAGARKCGALGKTNESIAILVTGTGLKDISGLLRSGVLAEQSAYSESEPVLAVA